jgi:drug/metabolite transporter (DMT)-like permease
VLAVPRRVAVTVFVLGLVVYAADSALYYAALSRTSASLASLLHYAYLAIVVVAAALLGRERLTPRRGAALAAVLAGVALVGGAGDRLDMIGVGLALTAAASYAVYVLLSDHLLRQADPLALAGLLTAGAATSFLAWSAVHGQLTEIGGAVGAGVVLATTVTGAGAVAFFLGGVRRVGPATASLLVAIEIPLTLGLAAVALGDRLDPSQLLGAVFVLAGIAVLRLRLPRRRGDESLQTG